ncbi:MAG TPA: DnaJ C-terminal domain-containing protein [Kiritimatiellia bacterium]|nr:DnaJ C-terminal domain-containing protein [Kiritimatiellia bacterium]
MERTTHYATLGLERGCSEDAIRKAYRLLSKVHHPDLNASAPESIARTQALNEAYAVLGNPARRAAYDQELARAPRRPEPARARGRATAIRQDVHLTIRELFLGSTLTVHVRDPATGGGVESFSLEVPAGSAPGTRFRITRGADAGGGSVMVRVKVRPDRMFKAKGSDLRCDLKISVQRARTGGVEFVRGPQGNRLSVEVPARVQRGVIIRVHGEGLPKARGARGDLLVRILYRPEIRIERRPG